MMRACNVRDKGLQRRPGIRRYPDRIGGLKKVRVYLLRNVVFFAERARLLIPSSGNATFARLPATKAEPSSGLAFVHRSGVGSCLTHGHALP
jgi:hypothetical protein